VLVLALMELCGYGCNAGLFGHTESTCNNCRLLVYIAWEFWIVSYQKASISSQLVMSELTNLPIVFSIA